MKRPNVIYKNGIGNNFKSNMNLQIDPAKRIQMIAISAYFRAERRGFSPNLDLADWFESEQEVDRHLSAFS